MPVQMEDGENHQGIVLDRVDHSVGETPHTAPPLNLRQPPPRLGLVKNALHGALQLVQKLQTKSRHGLFVVSTASPRPRPAARAKETDTSSRVSGAQLSQNRGTIFCLELSASICSQPGIRFRNPGRFDCACRVVVKTDQ